MPEIKDPIDGATIAADEVFVVARVESLAEVESDEITCRWSFENIAHADMADDCFKTTLSDAAPGIICHVTGLEDGAVDIFIACGDPAGNELTPADNTRTNYFVDTSEKIFTVTTGASFNDYEDIQKEKHRFTDLDMADYNGDGHLDAITWQPFNDGPAGHVWFNDGSGEFAEENSVVLGNVEGIDIDSLPMDRSYDYNGQPADMNGDGALDYILALDKRKNQLIFGNGANSPEGGIVEFGDLETTQTVCAADVDGDGDLDVFEGKSTSRIWLNDGMGTLSDSGRIIDEEPGTQGEVQQVISEDFDNDGDNDFLDSSKEQVWFNDGSGIFSIGGTRLAMNIHNCAGDLTGDGYVDFLVDSRIQYTNDGSGNFSQLVRNPQTAYSGANCFIADFDGDGDNDSYHTPSISMLMHEEYGIDDPPDVFLVNDGSGNMTSSYEKLRINMQSCWWQMNPGGGDLDGDGDVDILEQVDTDGDCVSRLFTRFNISDNENETPGEPDTERPTIVVNQEGDDTWRDENTGVYDVDFFDTGGSGLAYFQVIACKNDYSPCGEWATVTVDINSDSYTEDWKLPDEFWNGLAQSKYYILVQVFDNAGNSNFGMVFYVRKDMVDPKPIVVDPKISATVAASSVFISAIIEDDTGYDCRWSLEDKSFVDMDRYAGSDNDCYKLNGGGYYEYYCNVSGMEDGEETVYIACGDEAGNEHTEHTNTEISYNVDTSQMIFEESKGLAWWEYDWDKQQEESYIFTDMDIADMNGDGHLDVITWHTSFGAYWYDGPSGFVWYNDGTGEFSHGKLDGFGYMNNYDNFINGSPADMNGDGKLDLVVAQQKGKCQVVYEAWEDGAFSEFGDETGALAVYPADVDGDGDLDVMGAGSDDNRVWLNDGNGNLADSGQTLVVGGNDPNQFGVLEAVDIDNDGDKDFVDGVSSALWKNDGSGTFTGYANSSPGTAFCSGDLDGDGDVDFMEGTRMQYINHEGNFQGSWLDFNWSVYRAHRCFIADFDGDGDNDSYNMANTSMLGAYLIDIDDGPDVVLLNDGAGGMMKNYQNLRINSSGFIWTIRPMGGDLDGDGDVDIVEQANTGDDWFSRLYTRLNISDHANSAPTVPAAVDENDFISVFPVPDTAVILEWGAGYDPETPDSDLLTYDVRIGTQSGGCEVFCGTFPGAAREGYFYFEPGNLWRGSGPGNVGTATSYIIDLATGTYFWAVRTVDTTLKASEWSPEDSFTIEYVPDTAPPAIIDNQADGYYVSDPGPVFDIDFEDTGNSYLSHAEYTVWSQPGMAGVEILPWTTIVENIDVNTYSDNWAVDFDALDNGDSYVSVRAFDNAGNSSGPAMDVFRITVTPGYFTSSGQSFGDGSIGAVYSADFDGDGDADLVLGNVGTIVSLYNEVWMNDGIGNFIDSGQMLGGDPTNYFSVADLDGDGDLDLVAGNGRFSNSEGATDYVYFNDGLGVFTMAQQLEKAETWSVDTEDMDGDGDIDIVTTNLFEIVLWDNEGSGGFSKSDNSISSTFASAMEASDVDGDGDQDLVSGHYYFSSKIFTNDGNGVFADTGQALDNMIYAMDAADYDGDGYDDIVFGKFDVNGIIGGGPDGATVWMNDGTGVFSDTGQELPIGQAIFVASGDANGDGAPDVVIGDGYYSETILWQNDGNGGFFDSGERIVTGANSATGFFVDVDGDTDQDYFGSSSIPGGDLFAQPNYTPVFRLLMNNTDYNNTVPSTPSIVDETDIVIETATTYVTLDWTEATDAETDAAALTYDVRIGTSSGGCDVYCGTFPSSEPWRTTRTGNSGFTEFHTLAFGTGTYFWSVRTIDSMLGAGSWSAEDSFTVMNDEVSPVQSEWSPAKGSALNNTILSLRFTTDENADCKWSLSDQAYSEMVGDCWNDGTTNIRCDMDGMTEGANTVYTACRDEKGNEDSTDTNEHIDYTVSQPSGVQYVEDKLNMEKIGTLGEGTPQDVFVQGNYAYVAANGLFSIVDISNSAAPVQVGYYPVGGARDVYVSGKYAYVAYTSGLLVIDVSDPSAPSEVGRYKNSYGGVDVEISGNYAYLSDGRYGMWIIDVSDPEAPSRAGYYSRTELMNSAGVYVSGKYAYLARSESGLWIIDVSDPESPVEVGSYETQGKASDVYVSGNYAYVVDINGVRVIDVSDPAAMVEVGSLETPGWAADVYVSGNYAYVTDSDIFIGPSDIGSGLLVIDVSDPSALVEVGSYDTPGFAYGFYLSGNHAYVADYYHGLRVIDVSNPAAPFEAGYYDSVGSANYVFISGNYAYVTDYSGLWVVDVSNPVAPVEMGYFSTPEYFGRVYVSGNYAYLAGSTYGLRVLDVSDPSNPFEVGNFDTQGAIGGVYVSGNYAYLADRDFGLRVLDVSDPAVPVEAGNCGLPGYAYMLDVSGNYAYVTDFAGFRVVDISDPAAPVKVGDYNSPESAYGVSISGNHAYIADYHGGLRVVDVSNPVAPVEVGFYDTQSLAHDVYASGNYAYVADWKGGLRVIDVSDPSAPYEAGHYMTPGEAIGVLVSDNYVYVADWGAGLWILENTLADTTAPVITVVDGADSTPVATDTINIDVEDLHLESASLLYAISPDDVCDASDSYDFPYEDGVEFHITGDHDGYLCVTASDTNENTSYVQAGLLRVDNTSPEFSGISGVSTCGNRCLMLGWPVAIDTSTPVVYNIYEATATGAQDFASPTYRTYESIYKAEPLTLGQEYYYVVRAEDAAGNESANMEELSGIPILETDETPPTDIAWVNDGPGPDIDTATSADQLSANWSSSGDPESGIARYYYAVGTSPGATDTVNWTGNATSTSVTETGLSLASGTIYYFSVMAENGAGLFSNISSSDGLTVIIVEEDKTPPEAIAYVNDGFGADVDFATGSETIVANWAASTDPESGIAQYLVGLGTEPGAVDVTGWIGGVSSTSIGITDLDLSDGITYYFSVVAENGEGLKSEPVSSDGVTIDTSAPGEVSGLSAEVDGTEILLLWKNPEIADFAGTKIIRKAGSYPENVSDGTEVCDESDNEYCTDSDGLEYSVDYHYAAFAYDGFAHYSTVNGEGARTTAGLEVPGLEIHAGWNMVGISAVGASIETADMFDSSEFEIIELHGGYNYLSASSTVSLENGAGYWIYTEKAVPDAGTLGGTASGENSIELELSEGWNMIANPFAGPVEWSGEKIEYRCGGLSIVVPAVYHYNSESGSYERLDPGAGQYLMPWKAYLVESPGDCALVVSR